MHAKAAHVKTEVLAQQPVPVRLIIVNVELATQELTVKFVIYLCMNKL